MCEIFNKAILSQDFYFLNILKTSIVSPQFMDRLETKVIFLWKAEHISQKFYCTCFHSLLTCLSLCFHTDPLQSSLPKLATKIKLSGFAQTLEGKSGILIMAYKTLYTIAPTSPGLIKCYSLLTHCALVILVTCCSHPQ